MGDDGKGSSISHKYLCGGDIFEPPCAHRGSRTSDRAQGVEDETRETKGKTKAKCDTHEKRFDEGFRASIVSKKDALQE